MKNLTQSQTNEIVSTIAFILVVAFALLVSKLLFY